MSQRAAITEKILESKRAQKLTWQKIAAEVAPGSSPVFMTAALLGQMSLSEEQARKAAALFGLDAHEQAVLAEPPMRGSLPSLPPRATPCSTAFRRFSRSMGQPSRIQEEFGDGIMSAIDFEMQLERQAHPKGDRVKITMSGKFLPYRRY